MTGFIALVITLLAIVWIYQIIISRRFAPWVPSHLSLLRQVLASLPLKADDHFIDLGCGDGRAVILAAKQFNLRADGVEIAPFLWFVAKLNVWIRGLQDKAHIYFKDLYQLDLHPYSIIYIYGLHSTLAEQIAKKFHQGLTPGTIVISYNFSLPNRVPINTIQEKWRKIMVYRI